MSQARRHTGHALARIGWRYDGIGRPAGWARDGDETAFHYGPRDRIARVDDGLDSRYRYYADERLSLETGTRIDRVAPFFAPTDDVMRAMPRIDRVSAAASSPLMRRHLISRGFASPELLNRFPEGIDLANGAAVIEARGHLTLALIDEGGLSASMLARTGLDADQLAALNPSLVTEGHQPLSPQARRTYRARPSERVNRHGEHLYRMFLQTGDQRYLNMYGYSLMRALHKNRWISWNLPSSFSF